MNNLRASCFNVFTAVILMIIFATSCSQKTTRKVFNLNDGWEFYYSDKEKWYGAQVPGNIHTDLLSHNLIGDPFYDTNADNLMWVSEKVWKYRKNFNISTDIYERNLEIVFDGLDTYAEVYLNGTKLGETNNMFKKWAFPIEDSLKRKDNILEVVINPSKPYNEQKEKEIGVAIDHSRIFTRKAQYQYGWDWGPDFETAGIFKDVYINIWEKLRITNVNIDQKELNEDIAVMVANIELESENYYNGDVKIISPFNEFDTLNQKLEIFEGKQIYPVEFSIKNPELWWCNGLGKSKLYDIKVQVSTKFRVEERDVKAGLRDIEFHNNDDNEGQEFYFALNGVPVFAKGANWIPAEYFNGSNSYRNYLDLLVMAKEANHNMIRIWGGGIYENDDFYNICDSLGIMVWQDFMFANGMYYATDDFIDNITGEITYQVNRLYNHPSIVLWCGNNEINNGWFDWGWQKQFNLTEADSLRLWNDYNKIFKDVIPTTLSKIDKSREYIHTSPLYGWGHKESDTHGDAHYWGVWWGMFDFNTYYSRTGRFMSEYGFQALPDVASFNKFAPKDSLYMKYIPEDASWDYSQTLKTHQRHRIGYETIGEYMKREYRIPEGFDEYVYTSQVLQAEGLQKAFDAHLAAMPYCMGTLYWQLNDCWPVTSWSVIDYYKNPKASYYYSKKSFEDYHISAMRENNNFEVFVINHRNSRLESMLIISNMDFKGNITNKDTIYASIPGFSSEKIMFENENLFWELVNDKYNLLMHIELRDIVSGDLLTDRVVTATEDKFLLLPQVENIEYKISRNNNSWEIQIDSKIFIKNLYLSCGNASGKFSDNYFNVLPGQSKTIYFYPQDRINELNLKSISMNDINSEWRVTSIFNR